jgi:hypothetical protein
MGERGSMTTDFPIYEQAALGELHEELGRLRLCEAAALTAMERSLMTLGQITQLVVHASAHGYEVLDGFKRLRAARSLNWTCLWVQVMKVGAVQAKLRAISRPISGWVSPSSRYSARTTHASSISVSPPARLLWHRCTKSTPIQPLSEGARGHRDTLVLTYRAGGFQAPTDPAMS